MPRQRDPQGRPSPSPQRAAAMLRTTRAAARLRLDRTAAALGVHPRTVSRWELGVTRPSPAAWARLVAFFATYAPQSARALAEAAGVPSAPEPAPVDVRGIEAAIYQAADRLDVAPHRVRAALRGIAAAVLEARGTLDDLVRASQEVDGTGPSPARRVGR